MFLLHKVMQIYVQSCTEFFYKWMVLKYRNGAVLVNRRFADYIRVQRIYSLRLSVLASKENYMLKIELDF